MTLASEVMSKNVVTIGKDASVLEAATLLREKRISCLVITEKDAPLGIVTERDFVHRALGKNLKKMKVSEIMTSPVMTAPPDTDLGRISAILTENRIRRVLISEGNKLFGIVTQTDIVSQVQDLVEQNKKILSHQNIQTILIVVCILLTGIILYAFLR